jgi:co-chaperonin GroES (HSP10)
MTSLEYTGPIESVRPLPGRILLELERSPGKSGSIVIPDRARDQKPTDTTVFAKVLAVGYGCFYEDGKFNCGVNEEDLAPGDRVAYRSLMQDMGCKVILTSVTRVDAVV